MQLASLMFIISCRKIVVVRCVCKNKKSILLLTVKSCFLYKALKPTEKIEYIVLAADN